MGWSGDKQAALGSFSRRSRSLASFRHQKETRNDLNDERTCICMLLYLYCFGFGILQYREEMIPASVPHLNETLQNHLYLAVSSIYVMVLVL